MMSLAWFAVGVLGVWRITHLLAVEDGPADVLARMRAVVHDWPAGRLLDCFPCASLWVAAPFAVALGSERAEQLLLWPALSGAAILLDRVVERAASPPPALYVEHPMAT
ncbi:MAG TPA: hypothetical protein VF055_08745, partial [Steroidobacteraceae bacterium]